MQDSGIAVLFKGINFQRLLGGLWVTMRIALISIGLSCVLGLLFGLLMLSRRRIAQIFCRVWLEIVRFMPQLVLLYIVYFGFARLSDGIWMGRPAESWYLPSGARRRWAT